MSNKKIDDLVLAPSLQDNMQLETDIGGVTPNKATYAQVKANISNLIKGQDNVFTVKQTYNTHPAINSDTDIIDKKYVTDNFEQTFTKGDLAEATSNILDIVGGVGSVIGSGVTIEVNKANTTNDGYLSNDDWNTFNNKQGTLTLPLSIANGGTNTSTVLTNDRVMISSANAIINGSITTTELGILHGIVNVSTGVANNDKFVTQGYVDDNNKYTSLGDVSAPYSNGGALTHVNDSKNGMSESTTKLGEPAANQFTLAHGTTTLTVTNSSTINQDLSTGSTPTHVNMKLTDLANGFVKSTTGNLSGGNKVDLTLDVTGILPQNNGGTGIDTSGVTNGQLLIGGTTSHDFKLTTITAGTGIGIVNANNSITISVSDSTIYWKRVSTQLQPKTITDDVYTEGSFNTTTIYKLNDVDINTTGTLTNIAYKAQDNVFTVKQTYNAHPTFTSNTDIIDKKYADDTFEPIFTKYNLTGSGVITVTSGTNSLLSSASDISISQSTTSTDGYLNSADWNTFNGKQDILSFPLSIALGGTNSSTVLANDLVMISSTGKITESVITKAELEILDGITGIATGSIDNDIFVTKGYVDNSATSGVVDDITVTDGQTSITLSSTPSTPTHAHFYLNGNRAVYGATKDFTISGTTLTWNDAGGKTLESTDSVIVVYFA